MKVTTEYEGGWKAVTTYLKPGAFRGEVAAVMNNTYAELEVAPMTREQAEHVAKGLSTYRTWYKVEARRIAHTIPVADAIAEADDGWGSMAILREGT